MLIRPGLSIGEVELGMRNEEVARALKTESIVFSRGDTAFTIFPKIGLQLSFDSSGRADFVTAHAPATADLFGSQILGATTEQVTKMLSKRGLEPDEIEADESNLYFKAAGVAITAEDSIVSGCSVFGPNYYE